MESGKGKQTLQFVVAPDSVINQGQQGAWQGGGVGEDAAPGQLTGRFISNQYT